MRCAILGRGVQRKSKTAPISVNQSMSLLILRSYLLLRQCDLEMAWAAKRLANKPLTGLFTGLQTARFYLRILPVVGR